MSQPPKDDDEALSLLEAIEVAFRRMIAGIFRFVFMRLPIWFYELCKDFFDWLGRVLRYMAKLCIRLVRVLFFAAVWGILVFGPLGAALYLSGGTGPEWMVTTAPTWTSIGVGWVAVGLIGSIWGLNRWWQQTRPRVAPRDSGSVHRKSIWQTEVTPLGCLLLVLALLGGVALVIVVLAGLSHR